MQDATALEGNRSRRPAAGRLRQQTLRLAPGLIRRLDAYARRLSERTPGVAFSRTDAVRNLLERGLAAEGFDDTA
jgi:hypothetical protein